MRTVLTTVLAFVIIFGSLVSADTCDSPATLTCMYSNVSWTTTDYYPTSCYHSYINGTFWYEYHDYAPYGPFDSTAGRHSYWTVGLATGCPTPSPSCTGGTFCLNSTIEFDEPGSLSITGPLGQQGYQGTIPSDGLVLSACPFGSGQYSVNSNTVPWTCYTCGSCSCTAPVTDNETICTGTNFTGLNGSVIRDSTGFIVNPSAVAVQNNTWTLPGAGNYTLDGCAKRIHVVNCTTPTPTPTEIGTVTPTPTGTGGPVVYTFSMTNIERYANPSLNMALSYPSGWTGTKIEPGTVSCSYVSKWLNDDGWTQKSYKKDQSVDIEDFGSQGGGLNEATFHYHYGHGENGKILLYENSSYFQPIDVIGKWGNQNKWVMIESCEVLPNETIGNSWGHALGTSHGILGFASKSQFSYGSGSLFVNKFFEYALKKNETIANAYMDSTRETEPSDRKGAVVFKNRYQFDHDHFPGHGEVAPNEESGANIYYFTWPCKGATEEKPWWQLWG